MARGGRVKVPGSNQTTFVRTVPGPTFENVRNIPSVVHRQNQATTLSFMPVDPTVATVTHTHGLVVKTEADGTAEEWFTAFGNHGPTFVSTDDTQPNDQHSTPPWYHGHTVGGWRVDAGRKGDQRLPHAGGDPGAVHAVALRPSCAAPRPRPRRVDRRDRRPAAPVGAGLAMLGHG